MSTNSNPLTDCPPIIVRKPHPTLDEELRLLVRPERNDFIYVGSLSEPTFEALRLLADAAGWPPRQVWMSPEDVLMLISRLKNVKDDVSAFPKGKWATIQALERAFEDGMWERAT